MESVIIKEIRRVGSILIFGIIFMMVIFSIITNMSVGKVQEQNEQIIQQNQQIIELLQQDKQED